VADGAGAMLMPGLIESHAHLSFTDIVRGSSDFIDDISLTPLPIGPTQTAGGTISFTAIDTVDTPSATFVAENTVHTDVPPYVGPFPLNPLTQKPRARPSDVRLMGGFRGA